MGVNEMACIQNKRKPMKTAMQIAVESYKNDGVSFTDWFMDNYEILLEKEKEQIINAHLNCQSNWLSSFATNTNEAEDYYNQTYKQND